MTVRQVVSEADPTFIVLGSRHAGRPGTKEAKLKANVGYILPVAAGCASRPRILIAAGGLNKLYWEWRYDFYAGPDGEKLLRP